MGRILSARGRYAEAEECFRIAMRLDPESSTSRYNLSMLALMQGDYGEGFLLYESRFDAMQSDNRLAPGDMVIVGGQSTLARRVAFRETPPDLDGARIRRQPDDVALSAHVEGAGSQRSYPIVRVHAGASGMFHLRDRERRVVYANHRGGPVRLALPDYESAIAVPNDARVHS